MKADRLGRISGLALAAVAAVALWKALQLERWSFDGPDAGLFPQMMAGICLVLALIVAIWPGRPNLGEDGDGDASEEAAVITRKTFAVYAVALLVLAAGALFAGYVITAVAVTVLLMRFGEGRSWRASAGYGVACAVVGMVLFGWLLRVDLPEGPIERAFYSMVR